MMEERYHVTTQNRFYPDMSNVLLNKKKYYSGGQTYQLTYVLELISRQYFAFLVRNTLLEILKFPFLFVSREISTSDQC